MSLNLWKFGTLFLGGAMLVGFGIFISKIISSQNQPVTPNEKSRIVSQNNSDVTSKPPSTMTPLPSSTIKNKNLNTSKEISAANINSSVVEEPNANSTPTSNHAKILRVIGVWKNSDNLSWEFIDNGTLLVSQRGSLPPLKAKYSFLNDGRMLIEAMMFGVSTGETYQVKIIENTMTLTSQNSKNEILTRIK
jgi:hypothetical protein